MNKGNENKQSGGDMHPFEEQFYNKVKNTIASWPADFCNEVSHLALVYGGTGDRVNCQNDFCLTYNTWPHFHQRVAEVGEWDANWVPAEWVCDYLAETPEDNDELQLWHDWCRDSNIPYHPDKTFYDYDVLTDAGIALCCRVIQHLNVERTLEENFGAVRPLYIIHAEGWINEEATLAANSHDLLHEFLKALQELED